MSSAIVGTSTRPYSGFDPRSIQGCSLWLDAADSSTLTLSGSNVTQWNDKSGNGRNATTTPTSPTYSSNSIVFNGAAGLSTSLSASTNVESGFMIVNCTTLSVVNTILGGSIPEGGRQFRLNNAIQTVKQNIVGVLLTGANLSNNVTYLVGYTNNGTTLTHFNNGSVYASASSVSYNASIQTIIGTRGDGLESFNGSMREIIVFNNSISTSDRQQLEGYLAWKWGLRSNLPATHPFRTETPYARQLLPIDITPSLWLDAADVSTMTLSGSNVTQWRDKSGNGSNATTSGTSPLVLNRLNKLPGIQFTGTNFFTGSSTNTGSTLSTFAVSELNSSTANYGRILSFSSSGQNDYDRITTVIPIVTFGTAQTIEGYRNGADLGKVSITYDSPFIASSIFDATNHIIYRDGTIGTTVANTGLFNYTLYSVSNSAGNTLANTRYIVGYVYEVIAFNAALSTSQRQQIEGYLAHKWGLVSNLPSTHLFKLYPPLQVAFTPVQVSGCSLWLDAADSSTITLSGSNVTQWRDKSGNARHAIGNIGTGSYSSTGLNSLPTVQITSTGNMVSSIPAGSFSNGIVVFVVFQKTGANNTADTIVTRTAPNSIPSPFDIYGGLNQPTVTVRIVGDGTNYRSGSDNPNSVTRLTSPTIWSVSIFSTTPANWIESVNGTSRTLTLSSLSGNGNYGDNANFFYIGTRGDNFTKMTGNISEIIAYNASLFSAEQRQQIEGYLAHKWGLTSSLPATHPFKKIRP